MPYGSPSGPQLLHRGLELFLKHSVDKHNNIYSHLKERIERICLLLDMIYMAFGSKQQIPKTIRCAIDKAMWGDVPSQNRLLYLFERTYVWNIMPWTVELSRDSNSYCFYNVQEKQDALTGPDDNHFTNVGNFTSSIIYKCLQSCPADPYDSLAKLLSSQTDTVVIVSLNYDTLLDEKLIGLAGNRFRYDFGSVSCCGMHTKTSASNPIIMIKPNGPYNFGLCTDCQSIPVFNQPRDPFELGDPVWAQCRNHAHRGHRKSLKHFAIPYIPAYALPNTIGPLISQRIYQGIPKAVQNHAELHSLGYSFTMLDGTLVDTHLLTLLQGRHIHVLSSTLFNAGLICRNLSKIGLNGCPIPSDGFEEFVDDVASGRLQLS